MKKKLSILTVSDHFLPAYKAGGAVRTLSNMVERLGGEFDFCVLTGDRDLGEKSPYPGLKRDQWVHAHGCRVFYLSPARRSWISLKNIIGGCGSDLIYLNSFFSMLTIKILLLRRLGLLPHIGMLIAPRGEFSPGALVLKQRKKAFFIRAAAKAGLYDGLLWQASSEHEQGDIKRHFPGAEVFIAPDLPPAYRVSAPINKEKKPGHAEFVFVSRLSRKKNIHFALQSLARLKGEVSYHLYGPVEDEPYFAQCRAVAESLPSNIKCCFCGSVPHEEIAGLLSRYHFFFFPTLGENFGHVILEALSAGLPVIISDQTPWRNLAEKGAGWDLALEGRDQFVDLLQRCIDMPGERYAELSRGAHDFAAAFSSDSGIICRNRELFYRCAAGIKR